MLAANHAQAVQEAWVVAPVPCPAGRCQMPNGLLGGSQIQTFDDKVFNLEPKEAPKVSISASGQPRYLGDAPDYHSAQHKQWLQECESLRRKNFAAFRKCYFDKKKAALALSAATPR